MWFDFVVLGVLAIATIRGAQRGFIWQVAAIAGLIICFMFSQTISAFGAPYIPLEPPLNHWVTMFVAYLAISFAAFGVARMMHGWIEGAQLKEYNRHLGAVFGLIKGIAFCLIAIFFIVTMSQSARQALKHSQSAHYAAIIMDRLHPLMPEKIHDALDDYIHVLDSPELDLRHSHDGDVRYFADDGSVDPFATPRDDHAGHNHSRPFENAGSSIPRQSPPGPAREPLNPFELFGKQEPQPAERPNPFENGPSSSNQSAPSRETNSTGGRILSEIGGAVGQEIGGFMGRVMQNGGSNGQSNLNSEVNDTANRIKSDVGNQVRDRAAEEFSNFLGGFAPRNTNPTSDTKPAPAQPRNWPADIGNSFGSAPRTDPTNAGPQQTVQQQQTAMIREIASTYSNDPTQQRGIEREINTQLQGLPEGITIGVVTDWRADQLSIQPDPDPKTSTNTDLDQRIIRQLTLQKVPVDRLSSNIQDRLRAARQR